MVNRESRTPSALWASVWIVLFLLFAFLTAAVAMPYNLVVTADQWFENLLLSVRTPLLIHIFDGITFLGNTLFVVGIAGVVGAFLLYSKVYKAYAIGLAGTLIMAATTGYAMKIMVARARPSGLIPSMIETSFSFPSGHATAAMALYGFMAYLLCTLFPAKKPLILSAAILIVGGIGFSRLYLGVHFPSDIIAGYLLGSLCLLIGIQIVNRLRDKEAAAPQEALLH